MGLVAPGVFKKRKDKKMIKLKSVFENQDGYAEVWEALNKKYVPVHKMRRKIFKDLNTRRGYSHVIYHGKLNKDVDITPLELAMILDRGYSWFGGSVSLEENGNFICEIYTD